MKNYTMFCYEFLLGDHMAKVSNQAKLYYIALNFNANNGFVANPLQVLDSFGYDKGVYYELVNNGELLTLPDRCEVFITSYFIHNKGMNPLSWRSSPFAVYWKGKLFIKKENGVATFKPQGEEPKQSDPLDKIKQPEEDDLDWDKMISDLETPNQH